MTKYAYLSNDAPRYPRPARCGCTDDDPHRCDRTVEDEVQDDCDCECHEAMPCGPCCRDPDCPCYFKPRGGFR